MEMQRGKGLVSLASRCGVFCPGANNLARWYWTALLDSRLFGKRIILTPSWNNLAVKVNFQTRFGQVVSACSSSRCAAKYPFFVAVPDVHFGPCFRQYTAIEPNCHWSGCSMVDNVGKGEICRRTAARNTVRKEGGIWPPRRRLRSWALQMPISQVFAKGVGMTIKLLRLLTTFSDQLSGFVDAPTTGMQTAPVGGA